MKEISMILYKTSLFRNRKIKFNIHNMHLLKSEIRVLQGWLTTAKLILNKGFIKKQPILYPVKQAVMQQNDNPRITNPP